MNDMVVGGAEVPVEEPGATYHPSEPVPSIFAIDQLVGHNRDMAQKPPIQLIAILYDYG